MKVNVISIFQDKFTGKLYNPGEVIEIEDKARVEDLKERKLAEVVEEKNPISITLFEKEFEKKTVVAALKAIGEKATMNMKEETLLENIAALGEEATAKLKEALGTEA